ncbi:FecR domain-containing protein [Pedobacter sp. PF22-3]|uniref:FecR family protein n=1 Tax=Pedobacter sp. PF22-3 TaxID=2994467 RepID=UPI00224604A7|nr:FecR domain-containing protein [Pedobacter sp. PF22-3]MCX2491941.1 FecR domain-containing protein [Pedobacter sp. PF22-3]
MDQRYYKLIEDYSKKTIGSEDLTDLLMWVGSSQENQQIFRETLQAFEAADYSFNKPVNQQKSWSAIQQHIENNAEHSQIIKKINYRRYFTIAAAIMVIALLPILYFNNFHSKAKEVIAYNEIYNPRGQKRLVTMPDGSNIYLNGDSKIRYALNFNTGKRVVYLSGEAFFDVQHRSKQPFIVNTGKVSTTVLGTSFNINAYPSLKDITVTVQTGKVGVIFSKNGKNSLVRFLLPNEQLTIDKNSGKLNKMQVNATDFNGWREYKLFFYDKPLSEIAEVIAREYDLDIEIKTEALKGIKLTAKFDKCSVKQIMDVIAKLSNSKYTIYENKVIIYER